MILIIARSGTDVALFPALIEAGSAWPTAAAMPEFLWNLSFGLSLIVKGFKPAPIAAW